MKKDQVATELNMMWPQNPNLSFKPYCVMNTIENPFTISSPCTILKGSKSLSCPGGTRLIDGLLLAVSTPKKGNSPQTE